MKNITTIEQWEALCEESREYPVVLFKHSNACGGSARAFTKITAAESHWAYPLAVVVVQNAREVSDRIAFDTGVEHESPQVLIIKNKQAVYDASHAMISAEEIQQQLRSTNT
jgi:bacillithiol system protein YtxJ